MLRLFTLLILTLTVFISENSASVTLLLTGRSSDNVYKHQLARQLIDSFDELIEGSQAKLFAFIDGVSWPVATENDDLLETWTDLDLPGNLTTLVFTNLGTDEMSLDHLSIVQRFMKTKTQLIVIEIGNPAIQTRALLERSASCAIEGHAAILSPNTVYFCNNAVPATLGDLRFDSLHPTSWTESKHPHPKPQTTIIMPNIFASAAKVQRQHPNQQHQKHHLDENVDEIVNKIMEEIDVDKEDSSKEPTFEKMNDAKKKAFCKYRKSCYETGTPPVIDNDWFFYPSHWLHKKKVAEEEGKEHEEGAAVEEGDEDDLLERKFRCKYRLSCYHEKGIPLSEREAEKERKSILASKEKVQPGKKKTLKEIAAKTLQEVQEASEKAAKRPVEKVVQTKLAATQEKLDEKLNCKYRKSCYETGKRPVIDEGWKLPLPINIFSTESAETVGKQINYSEMENLQKKVYCKYRKSCYETGVKPQIEPELFIYTLLDLFTIPEQVETRKLTLQEKCKYRKSCYETGIVPEINPKLEAVIKKEVSPVIPTNVQDLKLLCKYRKSCYAEIHEAATVDTIKHIRKRRQIEKEVTRRKARREKLHRRLRGEMQLGHWRKYFRKDKAGAEPEEPEPEEISDIRTPKPIEPSQKPMQEEEQIKKEEEEQEEAEVKKPKTKKQRQPKKTAAPLKAIVDEAISTAEEKLEETPVAKKFRKARKMSVDEQKEEPSKKPSTPLKTSGKAGRKASQVEEVETPKVKEEVKPTESTETEEMKPGKVRKAKETPKEVSKRKKKVRFQIEEEKPEEEEEEQEEPEERQEEVKQPTKKEEEQSEEEGEEQKEEEEEEQQKEEEEVEEAEEEEEEEEMVKKEVPKQTEKEERVVADKKKKPEEAKPTTKEERVVVERKKPPNASKATDKEKTTADALEDMIEQIHHQHEIQHKKEYCKYRKSCYSSGKKPKIDSSVVGIISSFGEQLEKAYEEEEDAISRVRSELDKKVACKYRKSCYETGILPEIKKPIVVDDDSMAFKVGLSKHLQCKYRKSCYEKNGLKPIHHEAEEVEEKRKPEHAKIEEVKETVSERASEGKRSPKMDRQPVEQQKQAEHGKKEEECKPGTACYISAAPKTLKEDHAGSMARIGAERYKQSGKCSPYYYSCREVLGLPRKERAPIGPNGRRLCRKKQL